MTKVLLLFFTLSISWLNGLSHQEGFLENTLVVTPAGYQNIQDLHAGDIIYNENFQERMITNTCEYLTDQHLQLDINHAIINCAFNQQFYVPQYQSWVKACNLTEKECNSIKIIQQPALIYCLTVQDHTFQISQNNIIVHNSAAAVVAPSIILSFIQLTQPVLMLLGTTASLYCFSSYNPAKEQGNTIVYQASPKKTYFDERYQKLCKLKQEFLSVHAAVKSIKCQFQDHYTLLSYQQLFNKNFTQTFNITAQQEAELDFEQRLQLTQIRQKILQDLEDEICNIQIAIGLFVNEAIARKNATIEYYNTFIHNNQDPLHQCLKLPNNITYNKILNYYVFTALCNMLLEEIDMRNNECLLLHQCFHHKSEIFNKTSNIIDILNQTKQDIALSQPSIENNKLGNHVKIQNVIIYFKQHPTYAFPSINSQILNTKKELHHYLENTSKQKSQIHGYPKINPQQDPEPDDDDDREIPRIYIDAKYHGKKTTAIKSAAPKNGQAALDFSFPVTKKIRVGVSENEIVILGRTLIKPQGGSEWHGYATTWDDLNRERKEKTKNILIENGLVNTRGKIL